MATVEQLRPIQQQLPAEEAARPLNGPVLIREVAQIRNSGVVLSESRVTDSMLALSEGVDTQRDLEDLLIYLHLDPARQGRIMEEGQTVLVDYLGTVTDLKSST